MMKPGLGDAVVETSLRLEKMVADKLGLPGCSLGKRSVVSAIHAHLSPAGVLLFDWWNGKRNAIIHYGGNTEEENERAEIRKNSDPKVLSNTGGMIVVLIAGRKKDELEVEDTCRDLLPDDVFEEIFGKSRKNSALFFDPPRGGKSSTGNTKKPTNILDLLLNESGEIHGDQANQIPPNKLKLNSKSESCGPKLISIKLPILVPDLAARLGVKPFNVMADLIKIGVYPAPNQPLEPEIAAKICEIHGFTFE